MRGIIFEGKHKVSFSDDLAKPEIKHDEVLIKVKRVGICG